jgi:two-component system phosphate regulon response regulator PhoB
VTKPFSVRELILRVRAILKRAPALAKGAGQEEPQVHSAGPIELDVAAHRVKVSGHPVVLTITEFKLLSDLVRARGRVRSRESLLSEVWGYDSEVMSRTVDTHMRRLREKLGPVATWLRTVRGVGYQFRSPEED